VGEYEQKKPVAKENNAERETIVRLKRELEAKLKETINRFKKDLTNRRVAQGECKGFLPLSTGRYDGVGP